MDYEEFCQFIRVPRETHMRLLRYVELIQEWSASINLVSSGETLWQRHIIDSAQIAKQIPEDADRQIVDMGSGGGLPGIVLAIILPNPIKMIESDRRKSLFLKHCIQEMSLTNASVENSRIERAEANADFIVARALASLPCLLSYSERFLTEDSICLFPKGRNYAKECREAQALWEYEKEVIPSISGDGVLLRIRKIKKKTGGDG